MISDVFGVYYSVSEIKCMTEIEQL